MNPAWYILAVFLAGCLLWLFWLYKLVINRGLVVGPWIKGRTRSKGYWWPWLKRQGRGWTIAFKPNADLHAVLDYAARIPATAKALRFRYRCERVNVWPAEALLSEPVVTLVLQRKGDDWSAKGNKASYRLYSAPMPLTDGEHDFTVPLEGWTNVWGKPADMAAVTRDLSNIAVAFGHRGGRMHGVGGKGAFTMIELEAI